MEADIWCVWGSFSDPLKMGLRRACDADEVETRCTEIDFARLVQMVVVQVVPSVRRSGLVVQVVNRREAVPKIPVVPAVRRLGDGLRVAGQVRSDSDARG